jgi:hypothetical protein
VKQPSGGIPPYQVSYSGLFRKQAKKLLVRAKTLGRFTEIAQVMQDINTRLEWIPLDFGEPLRDLVHLGLQERIGTIPPLVVTFAADEAKRLVYVALPFKLLPKSGF